MKLFSPWRTALRNKLYRDQLLISLGALVVVLLLLGAFLEFIGARMGVVVRDPVLALFPPARLTWILFSLIYAGFLLGLISLAASPYSFLLALRAVVLLIVLRGVCLWLLPLDAPPDSIPLADPFVHVPGFRDVPLRDLFFSWHTSILSLLAFTSRWRDLKIVFAAVTVLVSVLMLIQHAHYTIDLVAAPCFAYASCGAARWLTVQEVVPLRV